MWQEPGLVMLDHCSISGNKQEGVIVDRCSRSPLSLVDCGIFQNGSFGISMQNRAAAEVVRCRVFENLFWGINIKGLSSIKAADNMVFGNKCGGLWLGFNGDAKVVLERNAFERNNGMGFRDEYREGLPLMVAASRQTGISGKDFERLSAQRTASRPAESEPQCALTAKPTLKDNTFTDNKEMNLHPPKITNECGYCCEAPKSLVTCSGCQSIRYCGKACQLSHWPRHKVCVCCVCVCMFANHM